jgi:hypothetical protein
MAHDRGQLSDLSQGRRAGSGASFRLQRSADLPHFLGCPKWVRTGSKRRFPLRSAAGNNRPKCGAANASCGISSSGSARENQHLSYAWIVSPRSSMAMNSAILRALVSAFWTLPIRYRIA